MRKFGLIGYPLNHSFSPRFFANKFEEEGICDAEYKAYPLENIEAFSELYSDELHGINVTIPYKEQVIPFMDELSPAVQEIGALNTILFKDGKKIGYNTDVYGFQTSLTEWCADQLPEKALILGSGGAAKAVKYVFDSLDVSYKVISRSNPKWNYDVLDQEVIEDHLLIVNTTPLGMYPNEDKCPDLLYQFISEKHYVFDLIYNPEKTLFLRKAEDQGAQIKNGLEMLILQAERSWQIWNQTNK